MQRQQQHFSHVLYVLHILHEKNDSQVYKIIQEKSKPYCFIWMLNLEMYQGFQNNYMKRHSNSSICCL